MVSRPQARLLKQGGVFSYATVAKVAQCGDYFNSLGECPRAPVVRLNDKLHTVLCESLCSPSECLNQVKQRNFKQKTSHHMPSILFQKE